MTNKAQSEAPSVDSQIDEAFDWLLASYIDTDNAYMVEEMEEDRPIFKAKINRLIERSREELLNSIKQDLPKGEVNSMYHDLYSGHSKEWTQGFRTGYDICRNSTIATLEKVATPPVVSNNLSKEQLGEK